MKKILGSLLLIMVLWLGATAVIGNKTQSQLEKIIEKSNKTYLQHGIQFNTLKYQKSFFNSIATIEITVINKELESAISQTYGVVFPIVSEYQIEHGPLFFNNGLGIGVSKIHQEFEINSIFNQEIKDKFAKKSMLVSDIIVSFSKIANYEIKSDAIKIDDNDKKLHIDPLSMTGESHIETLMGEMQMKLPLISFVEKDKKIKLESIVLDTQIDKLVEKSFSMGEINLSMQRFYIADKESGEIEVQPFFHIESRQDGEKTFGSFLEMELNFKKATTQKSLLEMEKIIGKVKVNGLGIKGMKAYQESMQEIQKKQATLMIELQQNPDKQGENYAKLLKLQEEVRTKLLISLKDMLVKDKTSINYAFSVQSKDKKESRGDLLLGYTGDIDFNQTTEKISQKVASDLFSLFKIELDVSIDEKHIATFPNGDELLKQLQLPMTQTMVKHQNQKYSIKGYLKNRELILNDNNLTNSVLPLLKMLTQVNAQ